MMKIIHVVQVVMVYTTLVNNVLVRVTQQQNPYIMKIAAALFVQQHVRKLICLENHNTHINVYLNVLA